MVDDYLREVAEDTVKLVEATARRQGGTAESGALATVGIACGYTSSPTCGSTSEPARRPTIRRRSRSSETTTTVADRGFFTEPETRLAMSPLIAAFGGSRFTAAALTALERTLPLLDRAKAVVRR